MSTHALRTSEAGFARHLDLVVLVIGLPVFIVAGAPLIGWGAVTAGWLAARAIQVWAERRAAAKGDRRAAMAARAQSFVARLYITGLTVFGVGIADRDAGVAAGLLALAVFSVWLATQFVGRDPA